jgi:hypothetical protein
VDIYFRKPADGERGEFMPVTCAMQIVSGNLTQRLSSVNLGRAFMDQGYQQKRTSNSRGYIVVRRSAEEIQIRMHAVALDDKPF